MMMISDDDHNYAKKVNLTYMYMLRGRKRETWKPPLTLNHTVDANGIRKKEKKTNQWPPFRSSLPGKLISWLLRIIEALYTITRVGENDC